MKYMFLSKQKRLYDDFIVYYDEGVLNLRGILYCQMRFNIEKYSDRLFLKYNIKQPHSLREFDIYRRSEYLAGRCCANRLFKKLGIPVRDLVMAYDYSPIWPEGYNGALSHNNREVIMVICNNLYKIGIDIEECKNDDAVNIASFVLSSTEFGLLNKNLISYGLFSTIIHSSKESIFKALYPDMHSFYEVSYVRAISLNIGQGVVFFEITHDLSSRYYKGMILEVGFCIDNNVVITILII